MSMVTIIGGISADIEGRADNMLLHAESNPGVINISYGGAGRNISENLGRLRIDTKFFSVVGDDLIGRTAIRELADIGVDVSGVKTLEGEGTSMYISILDIMGDMELGLCNVGALEKISTDFIDEIADNLDDSKIIALDTNLSEELLAYAIDRFSGIPLFLDPVSTTKAERAKNLIGNFHTIKPSRAEAEVLLDMEIRSPEALEEAGRAFIEKGVGKVFISLSAGGVYYTDGKESGIERPKVKPIEAGYTLGAGDAFSAGCIYSHIKGYDLKRTADIALSVSAMSMEVKAPVNPGLSVETIEERT